MAINRLVQYANFAKTTLAEALDTSETEIDVQSVAGFPTITGSQYYYLVITRASDNAKEIVKVTSVSSLTLTVTRAQDSTTALAFAIGDKVELLFTAGLLTDIINELKTEIDKVDFADESAANHQDTAVSNTIAKLVSDAGGGNVLIHLAAGTYTFTESYTVPRNVTLVFEDGAKISVASGKTVTIKGRMRSGLTEIFTGSGSISITGENPLLPEWWGGYGDDSTDCQAAITAAYAALPSEGGTVQFSMGVYRVKSSVTLGGAASPHDHAKFLPGAMIGTEGSITALVYCPIDAGRHQIFKRSTVGGTFTGDENATVAYPEWFKTFYAAADSREAIEDAIAFLPAGGLLSFQPGRTYSIDEDIDVSKKILIEGGVLTLMATPNGGSSALHVTADEVAIRNMTIDVSGVTSGADYSGIYGNGADDLVIENVKVCNPDNATYAPGGYHAGIYLNDCDRARITSVHVTDSEKDAIALENCENCVLSDLTLKSAGQYGVSVHGGEHNSFSNVNVVSPGTSGAYLNASTHVSLESLHVDSPTDDGVKLNAAISTIINGGSIKASGSTNVGIEAAGVCDGLTVNGTRITGFTGSASAAISTIGASKNIAVVGCNLQGNYSETKFHSDTINTKVTGNILGGFQESYLLIVDEKPNETNPQSMTSGWNTRELTKKKADTGGFASLDTGSNEFTLSPGTYRFRIACPTYNVNQHQARLYDVTNNKTIELGSTEFSYGAGVHTDRQGNTLTKSIIVGMVAITSATTFKIEHWIANGDGIPPISGTGDGNDEPEIFTQAEFWRITEEAVSSGNLVGKNHTTLIFDAKDIERPNGTYAIGVLPKGTRITDSWYEITDAFTHANVQLKTADGDTIEASLQGSGAAGKYAGDQDGTVANFTSKTTGDTDVQAVVSTGTLTAGKLYLHLEYNISE